MYMVGQHRYRYIVFQVLGSYQQSRQQQLYMYMSIFTSPAITMNMQMFLSTAMLPPHSYRCMYIYAHTHTLTTLHPTPHQIPYTQVMLWWVFRAGPY